MRRYSRRELPPYRHRPGRTPHPERHPDGHSYGLPEPTGRPLESGSWRENEEYLYGVDLFNAGYFWEAHVAWEAVWNETSPEAPASRFVQALVQLAASFLKRDVDEPRGARKLLARSLDKLEAIRKEEGSAFMGADLDEIESDARAAMETVAPAPKIRLSLSRPGREHD